jgi:hypothetical protein
MRKKFQQTKPCNTRQGVINKWGKVVQFINIISKATQHLILQLPHILSILINPIILTQGLTT